MTYSSNLTAIVRNFSTHKKTFYPENKLLKIYNKNHFALIELPIKLMVIFDH